MFRIFQNLLKFSFLNSESRRERSRSRSRIRNELASKLDSLFARVLKNIDFPYFNHFLGFHKISQDFPEFSRISQDFLEFPKILKNFLELCFLTMAICLSRCRIETVVNTSLLPPEYNATIYNEFLLERITYITFLLECNSRISSPKIGEKLKVEQTGYEDSKRKATGPPTDYNIRSSLTYQYYLSVLTKKKLYIKKTESSKNSSF